jgi:hypothetical protein
LLAVAVGTMALLATAQTARADGTGPSVTPKIISGNTTCKTLLGNDAAYELKIDPPKSGTFGPITATISDDGTQVDFTSTVPVLGVFVKGGNIGGNFYDYRPAGTLGDNNLTTPTGPQGQPQQISHVSFCWNSKPEPPKEALTASKTADATYDRTIKWDLTKSVDPDSHNGNAGDSFGSDWTVKATKTATEDNFEVTGKITITNPNATAVGFDVTDKLDDGTVADVDCDPNTAGNQASATVAAGGSVECSYVASAAKATSNTATVSAPGNKDVEATAPVSYTANVIGDESVTLGDASPKDTPPVSFSQPISDSTTKTFDRTFACPTDPAKYTNFLFSQTNTNTATLKGPNTTVPPATASVTFNCKYPWRAETATGNGTKYPGTSNWFMYTPYQTTKVDLIAGQNYDAGDILMTRDATKTYITVTLASGFRFANVKENLKIQDFAKAPTSYVEPGSFKYKFTVTPQSTVTYTAKIPGTTAKFYGIHASVERFVN